MNAERQHEGIAKAKAEAKCKGRKPTVAFHAEQRVWVLEDGGTDGGSADTVSAAG